MPCVLHERAQDLWVLVFLSAGLQPWLMRRLSPGSLLQISSVVMKAGWLDCHAWISTMSLLLCPGTEFSQRCLTSAAKGQLRNVFILTTQPAWLVGKTSYHLHTQITFTSSASPSSAQPLSSHATQAHRRTPILTHSLPLLPIKIWRMKTVRWSFPPWHKGSMGNIQTALPQAMKSNRSSLQS